MQIKFKQQSLIPTYQCNFQGKKRERVANLINEDRMVDSFINLTKVDTGSKEKIAEKGVIPSTNGQRVLAELLAGKLKELGLADVHIDEHSILTATLGSNIGDESPVIGLLAHLDTSEDVPNKNVKPQVHNYKGGDIKLKGNTVISVSDLEKYVGQRVITSNGKTLLGADDKAGIAEILEVMNIYKENPHLKHPKIRIAFTPDEETGVGIKKMDIKQFGADLAYTIDGDLPQIVENGSFNAFNPEIIIKGKNTHSGYAYNKMINSIKIAQSFINKLPKNQSPETTKGKQGYFHVEGIQGSAEKTTINMLVRDFNYEKVKKRVSFVEELAKKIQNKYPQCTITVDPKEKYHNMKEKLDEFPEVVEYAKKGVQRSSLKPETKLIRGGTDGSQLSLKGLLTPNLGAGGHNFHSKSEFLPIDEMKKCVENIVNIMFVWAENSKKVMPKILLRR